MNGPLTTNSGNVFVFLDQEQTRDFITRHPSVRMKLIKKTIHKSIEDPEDGSEETIEDIDIVENEASDILTSDLATDGAEAKIKVLQKGEETNENNNKVTVEVTITKKKTIMRSAWRLNKVLLLIIFFLTLATAVFVVFFVYVFKGLP